ncbi:MAG: hypothetical protein IKN17_08680 [Ruminococcus sp.]|nr:hypothetical protein [Ruminococcus sp.]
MKRILASSLAVLLAGAALASCGDASSSSKADTASSAAAADSSVAETSSAAEESKADESSAPESKAEESKAEESQAEESQADSSAAEESKPDEATTDIKYDPNATETVIELEEPDTGAWANCFGADYIDYHTIPKDTDLTMTVEIKLSDTFLGMMDADILVGDEQIGFAPTSMTAADSWVHLGENLGWVTSDEYPVGVELATMENGSDGTYKLKAKMKDGEVRTDKKGNVLWEEDVYMVDDDSKMAPLYSKPDGFIKWNDQWKEWGDAHQTVTFTISKDATDFMFKSIEEGLADGEVDENGVNSNDYGGLLFQCSGNFEVVKVTINHGNILLNSQYQEWAAANPGAVWGE